MSLRCVILQIGSRFITAGFAGDPHYSTVLPTNDLLGAVVEDQNDGMNLTLWDYTSTNTDLIRLEYTLERVLYEILTKHLLTDPKRCKLTILELLHLPTPYKEIITRVCLYNLHCMTVSFIPEPIMSCVGSGSHVGLVVDLGWTHTRVTPVFDLRIMYKEASSTVRAGKMIHSEMYKCFQSYGNLPLRFDFIERFIMEASYCRNDVSSGSADSKMFTFDGINILNRLRYEPIEKVIFGEFLDADNENRTVVELILDTFKKQFHIDLRRQFAATVIFTGGLSHIVGIRSNILRKLKAQSSLNLRKSSIKSLGSWKGASLYVSTVNTSSHSKNKPTEIHRDKYLRDEERLVDWTESLYS